MFKQCLIAGLFATSMLALATTPAPQDQIKALDKQINHLTTDLTHAQDKRGMLNKQLSHIDKQIGSSVQKLRHMEQERKTKELNITTLQKHLDELNKQLVNQQDMLGNHVRARYQIGEYQPLKWLLSQDEPYRISRMLTYYQYMIRSRQELIDHIEQTRTSINNNQQKLKHEITQIQQLELELTDQKNRLNQNKAYQARLIDTLSEKIHNSQSSLQEAKKNKSNLAKLLTRLDDNTTLQRHESFQSMRKKLPFPVHVQRSAVRNMNHGMTFFADEGAMVTAVHPGKVVFSDWLKGYGLLLIIDHGEGFMTLYAHNQSLFKRKGEFVKPDEPIASVGHSGGLKQNGLYFEIRHKGKVVSPREWLA